jgi:hypothetical protein
MHESKLAPSWEGSVVLDIGEDVGALLLHTSRSLLGHEIDLIPDDPCTPRTHSAVRERHLIAGVTCAAVYPNLRTGTYTIEGTDQRVIITGGQVCELEYESGCVKLSHLDVTAAARRILES